MTSTRARRVLAAGLCLVAVLAAVLPCATSLDFLVVPLSWEPAPDEASLVVTPAPIDAAAQPLSLRSLLPSRAPPVAGAA